LKWDVWNQEKKEKEKKKLQKLNVWNENLNLAIKCIVLENSTIEQWMYGIGKKSKMECMV
jgi:hypothetical protein